jgi:hypothetical protein
MLSSLEVEKELQKKDVDLLKKENELMKTRNELSKIQHQTETNSLQIKLVS